MWCITKTLKLPFWPWVFLLDWTTGPCWTGSGSAVVCSDPLTELRITIMKVNLSNEQRFQGAHSRVVWWTDRYDNSVTDTHMGPRWVSTRMHRHGFEWLAAMCSALFEKEKKSGWSLHKTVTKQWGCWNLLVNGAQGLKPGLSRVNRDVWSPSSA